MLICDKCGFWIFGDFSVVLDVDSGTEQAYCQDCSDWHVENVLLKEYYDMKRKKKRSLPFSLEMTL